MSTYAQILLVEDDLSLAQWVADYLQEQGFSVTHVARGDEVQAQVQQHNYDLILLDLMLPGMDGLEVCRALRGDNCNLPIIILTARADEFDEVVGLEVGANDYVIKPVRPRALLARIKAQLRQPARQPEAKSMTFGQLEINLSAKRVSLHKEEIRLSSGMYDLLCMLAKHAGKVMDRDTVFQALHGREYDGLDRRLDVMVSNLRKKLGDDPQNPQKIKTVWGKGYLFVADAW